ncbi:Uncharacterized protein TPAR_07760 [Tolypocladium paradoxum]|uniref:Uncharacterized protein n=1 Tax=Tolypocladium paradoxum TaxID=94208 RepID=A0A2S4KP98_9HYPO|nr:Uncharacterized protein TPAR_07760 [Tolypocladium paradoxum]
MAPREPYKVHSLSKHIEDTKKGLSVMAQYNRRPVMQDGPPGVSRKEPDAVKRSILGINSDSDDDTSDSDSSSDEGGSDFLRKLAPLASNATAAVSKRRSKDDEIADSDVERNASAKQAAPAEKSVPIKPEPESSDDSSSDSDSNDGEKNVKTDGVPIKKAPSTTSSSSSSSDSESDDERDSDSDSAEKPAVVKKSQAASEPGTSDSASGEESDEESDPKVTTNPAVNGNATTSTSSSEGSDSEESDVSDGKAAKPAQKDDDDSSASDSEESSNENADESIHIEDRVHGGQFTLPNFISPDFVLRKGDDGANGQDVARIFNQANMQGKQFWYFTVPSNVPISVVQNLEIPMDQAQRSERVFSHAGEDYGVFFNSMAPKSSIEILIPSADSTQYQRAPRQLDQVMHVRRITQLGADSATVGPSEKRAPRAQPKGLKARYQPIGVSIPTGKIGMDTGSGDEDTDMAEAPALPATANASPHKTSKKDKKHKEKGAAVEARKEGGDMGRKGKRKHTSSEDEAAAAAEQLMEESQTAESKTKKQKTARKGSPDLGSEPQSSAAAKKQTPVVPPTIPNPSNSFSSIGSTPVAASTPSGKAKKSKKAKGETAVPSSSQSLPALKQTVVPVPRQTVVPIPPIPKVSPVPVPQPVATPSAGKGEKKAKKHKDKKAAAGSSQQSPPPSAQPSRKNDKQATPVPPPAIKASV